MTKKHKWFHIRKPIWHDQSIGISESNWDKLNCGYFNGIKIDYKINRKTLHPGIFRIPVGTNKGSVQEMVWKGTKLYIFSISKLEKVKNEKEKVSTTNDHRNITSQTGNQGAGDNDDTAETILRYVERLREIRRGN
jgi:hypothetical protein